MIKKKEEKVKSKVTTKNSTLMFIYFYIKTLFLSKCVFLTLQQNVFQCLTIIKKKTEQEQCMITNHDFYEKKKKKKKKNKKK